MSLFRASQDGRQVVGEKTFSLSLLFPPSDIPVMTVDEDFANGASPVDVSTDTFIDTIPADLSWKSVYLDRMLPSITLTKPRDRLDLLDRYCLPLAKATGTFLVISVSISPRP